MFVWAVRLATGAEERKIFLREVLPMMINAGAKFNPAASLPLSDNEYQYFRQNWQNLLTEDYALANKNFVRRLIREAIAEYDIETVRGIIERVPPEKLMPRNIDMTPADFFTSVTRIAFRINDFPEAMSKPSPQHTDIKRKLDKGAEILRIFQKAGITWPFIPPDSTELTYIIRNEEDCPQNIRMNPLCLCHSPEALRKVIASGEYDTSSALAEILRKHNPSDIITTNNTQRYDRWEKYFGGALSCHMLSHLWEIVESGIDYGGEWANFRMLLAACWGNVNDIEDSINYGGNVNYKTWLGYTPLMYASFFNTSEAVKFLIKKGGYIE